MRTAAAPQSSLYWGKEDIRSSRPLFYAAENSSYLIAVLSAIDYKGHRYFVTTSRKLGNKLAIVFQNDNATTAEYEAAQDKVGENFAFIDTPATPVDDAVLRSLYEHTNSDALSELLNTQMQTYRAHIESQFPVVFTKDVMAHSDVVPLLVSNSKEFEILSHITYLQQRPKDHVPHLLVFYKHYFIAMYVTIVQDGVEYVAGIRTINDTTLDIPYNKILDSENANHKPDEEGECLFRNTCNRLFWQTRTDIEKYDPASSEYLVMPLHKPDQSADFFRMARSNEFYSVMTNDDDIANYYLQLIDTYKAEQQTKAQEEAAIKKQRQEAAELDHIAQLSAALTQLSLMVGQWTNPRDFNGICAKLDPQLESCHELLKKLPKRSQEELQQGYDRLDKKIATMKQEAFLTIESGERENPSKKTPNAGKKPPAEKTTSASTPAAKAASSTKAVEVRAASPKKASVSSVEETIHSLRDESHKYKNEIRSLNGALQAVKEKLVVEKAKARQQESVIATQRSQQALDKTVIENLHKELEAAEAAALQREEKNRAVQGEHDALVSQLKLVTAQCKKLEVELQKTKSSAGRTKVQYQEQQAKMVKDHAEEIASLRLQLQQANANTTAQREAAEITIADKMQKIAAKDAEIARLSAQLQDATASAERELASLRAQHMRELCEQQSRLYKEHQLRLCATQQSWRRTTEENQQQIVVIAELQKAFHDLEAKLSLQFHDSEAWRRHSDEMMAALRSENAMLRDELREAMRRENRRRPYSMFQLEEATDATISDPAKNELLYRSPLVGFFEKLIQ